MQAQESAVKHYRAFISSTQCLDVLRHELQGMLEHADNLLGQLPVLNSTCDEFSQAGRACKARKAENKQLHSKWCTCTLHTDHVMGMA